MLEGRPFQASPRVSYCSQGTDKVMPTEEKYFLQVPSAEATLLASGFLGSSAFLGSDFASFPSGFASAALASFLSAASPVLFGEVVAGGSRSAEARCTS